MLCASASQPQATKRGRCFGRDLLGEKVCRTKCQETLQFGSRQIDYAADLENVTNQAAPMTKSGTGVGKWLGVAMCFVECWPGPRARHDAHIASTTTEFMSAMKKN